MRAMVTSIIIAIQIFMLRVHGRGSVTARIDKSNGCQASFPIASTSSPSRPAQVNQAQGSFPVASIIMLSISIIGMGALVVCVFLRHRSSVRIKQSSSTAIKNKPKPFSKLWSFVLSWFSKSHLWRSKIKSATNHKQGDMTAVAALHATCTFVAATPSKFLAPPVVMQCRVLNTERFVVLCPVCCPLSAQHTCGDPKPWVQGTFADIPHLVQEQLPVSNQPPSIPHNVDIPPSNQDRSRTIEPPDLSPVDQPQSSSAPPKCLKRTLVREDLPVLFLKTSPR
ncbi:hypothetical protein EDB19DRAFT_783206 [Suillus lakei]|nr:hypothetical protein EDB19DRAFT_783206 [Suillus lakei]